MLYIGPLPPPVHGQAVVTEQIFGILQSRNDFDPVLYDTAERDKARTKGDFLFRTARHLTALVGVLRAPRQACYVSVNGRIGMLLTLLIVLGARLRGHQITLHHHFPGYVVERKFLPRILSLLGGKRAMHVTNCDFMSAQLQEFYPAMKRMMSFSAIGVIDRTLSPEIGEPANDRLTLGHMSNLTRGKGIELVIDSFASLASLNEDVELKLAGPADDEIAKQKIAWAQSNYGSRFDYVGPVYGKSKDDFFSGIDIFVNPTRADTQGIVNLEALARGVPVVASDICCIPSDLGDTGGIAVNLDTGDFVGELQTYVAKYRQNRREIRMLARKRYEELRAENERQVKMLLAHLKNEGED